MQFKNLSFITHPVLEGIMAQVICNNGKRLSVVAGEGTYSSSKDGVRAAVSKVEDVSSFEVMIGAKVLGWQSREDINNILKENNKGYENI
ncbi:hypothetical protein N9E82_00905 [bacterium]|nr:hypothetical protein [bacterium]